MDFSTLGKVRPVCQTVSRVTIATGYRVQGAGALTAVSGQGAAGGKRK
jgi:hypothetical protein